MTRFVPDPQFRRRILGSVEVAETVLRPLAEDVADRARQLAPDDPGTPGSRIADGVEVDVGTDDRGRQVGRILGTHFASHFSEFGTIREPERPWLRPALEEVVGPLVADTGGGD